MVEKPAKKVSDAYNGAVDTLSQRIADGESRRRSFNIDVPMPTAPAADPLAEEEAEAAAQASANARAGLARAARRFFSPDERAAARPVDLDIEKEPVPASTRPNGLRVPLSRSLSPGKSCRSCRWTSPLPYRRSPSREEASRCPPSRTTPTSTRSFRRMASKQAAGPGGRPSGHTGERPGAGVTGPRRSLPNRIRRPMHLPGRRTAAVYLPVHHAAQ